MHEIKLILPEITEDNEEVTFSLETFPSDVFNAFARFTRIPDYERILRFVVAYELLPLEGLKGIPILYVHGKSGSGKSTLGKILQRLNPRGTNNETGLAGGDNPKGWEQSLPLFRKDLRGQDKAFPMLTIDDLEPRHFGGDVGQYKLNFMKQVVDSGGGFTRGSADGTAVRIDAFCKVCVSSIHDLATLEGLSELERRVMKVKTLNISEWTDDHHTDFTRENDIEEHSDFSISPQYDELRHIFINEVANEMMAYRKRCNKILKKSGSSIIPVNRHQFFSPIIALSALLFDKKIEDEITDFAECFLNEETQDAESSLTKLVRAWIESPTSPYKSRQIALKRFDQGFSIKYSEINKFLIGKRSDGELSLRACNREDVIACMSSLGFRQGQDGTDTIFIKGELSE